LPVAASDLEFAGLGGFVPAIPYVGIFTATSRDATISTEEANHGFNRLSRERASGKNKGRTRS